jgi:hypothetical protein
MVEAAEQRNHVTPDLYHHDGDEVRRIGPHWGPGELVWWN